MLLTMIKNIPNTFSLLVQKAAIKRITMVMGIAAIVKPNSLSVRLITTTRNWIVKPRKKKKSNLRRAM